MPSMMLSTMPATIAFAIFSPMMRTKDLFPVVNMRFRQKDGGKKNF